MQTSRIGRPEKVLRSCYHHEAIYSIKVLCNNLATLCLRGTRPGGDFMCFYHEGSTRGIQDQSQTHLTPPTESG